MIPIVETFGAPVTEPQGNSARKTSTSEASERRSPATPEVSCQTVSKRSGAKTSPQVTVPSCATRPRSLRSRSTIIAFSARSFTEPSSRRLISSSSASHRPRGAVPFIGFVAMWRPSIRKNSSGEADRTRNRPVSR